MGRVAGPAQGTVILQPLMSILLDLALKVQPARQDRDLQKRSALRSIRTPLYR